MPINVPVFLIHSSIQQILKPIIIIKNKIKKMIRVLKRNKAGEGAREVGREALTNKMAFEQRLG